MIITSCKNLQNQVIRTVVVDNSSNPYNRNLDALRFSSSVDLLRLPENRGVGVALNLGVKFALLRYLPSYVLLLDQDSIVPKDTLPQVIEIFEKREEVGLIYLSPQQNREGSPEEVEVAWTSGSVIRSEILRAIQFREDFFIDQIDHDFSYNIRKLNYKIIELKVGLVHNLGKVKSLTELSPPYRFLYSAVSKALKWPHTGPTFEPPFRMYYIARNSLILLRERKIRVSFFLRQLFVWLFTSFVVNGLDGSFYPVLCGLYDGMLTKTGINTRFMPEVR